jgi:hypothetical protein
MTAFADLIYLCLITSFLRYLPEFKERAGRKRLMAIGAGFLPFTFRLLMFFI